ncbi:MAG: VOC family protein [Noviherbaspirillum sp.]
MSLAMLHLSIPVRNIDASLAFYRDLLGCQATRVQDNRIDFDFYGHHLVAQLSEAESAHQSVLIGEDDYPLRHFGVIVQPEQYQRALDSLRNAGIAFAMEPRTIFAGTPREQGVFLVYDPSGNALEFKALPDPHNVFSEN